MKADGIFALGGLFLAGWAYQTDNARVLGWAAALTAALLLVRPLIDLTRRITAWLDARVRPAVTVPIPAEPPLSPMDIAINAAVDRYAAARRAHIEKHVRR